MSDIARKRCSAEGCPSFAVIRVQPFKKATWDFYCAQHWIALAVHTVREAHAAGYLVVEKDDAPDTTTHLTLVDSTPHTLV